MPCPRKSRTRPENGSRPCPTLDTKADCETLHDEFVDRYKKTDK